MICIRRILAGLLSLAMVAVTPVHAVPTEPSGLPVLPTDYARELVAADEYHRQYADLEQAGSGQLRSALAPDRFLLMEQSAYPREISVVKTFAGHLYRKWKLNTLLKKTNAYLRAIHRGRMIEPDPVVLTREEIKESIYEHLNDGRRVDTPLFLWNRRADRAQLENCQSVILEIQRTWNYNQQAGIANMTNAEIDTKVRNINWWDVQVQVREGEHFVKTMPMRDTAGGVATGLEQPYFCSQQSCTFSFVKEKTTLNVFGIKSQVVGTFDQFVVFTHSDSYDSATGTQYISFLDLGTYNGLLGNESIPVFRLPLKIDESIRTLAVRDGRLVLNERFFIEREYFDQASEMQQVAFNLTANLIDPDSWQKVIPLVDNVKEFFDKTVAQEIKSKADEREGLRAATVLMQQLGQDLQARLDAQKLMKPMTEKEHYHLGKAMAGAGVSDHKEAAERLALYHKRVGDSAALGKLMSQTQERARTSRKFNARLRLLGATLISPRPNASQKIKQALGGWYVRRKIFDSTTGIDRAVKILDRPFVDAGVIGAVALRLAAPESFNTLVDTGLSFGVAITDYMVYALNGIGESFVTASKATFSAIYSPIKSIGNAYIYDGNWWRTAVGVSAFAGFLGALYFVPHFVFNFAQWTKDMRKPDYKGFVDWRVRVNEAYYKRIADEEAVKRSDSEEDASRIEFSPEEEAEIQEWLHERRSQRERGGGRATANEHQKMLEAALEQQTREIADAATAGEQSVAVREAADQPEQAKSFWWAFKHFAISMPSLELTLERWAAIWNWYASWRFTTLGFAYVHVMGSDIPVWPLKLKPLALTMRLLYPEFLSTSIFKNDHKGAVPSEMNGGLRSRCTRLYQRMCNLHSASGQAMADPKKQLRALEAFEDQIIKAEEQISEVAFRSALAQLPKFLNSPKDLKALFNSKSLNTITQKDILALSWSSKTFLRAYFESVYEAGMNKYLSEMLAAHDEATTAAISTPSAETPRADVRTLKQLKERMVRAQAVNGPAANFGFNIDTARNAALAVTGSADHLERARDAVKRGQLSWSNFAMNNKFDLVSDFDPKQNPSMDRVAVVHKRLQSPGALGRALRAEISKLKLTLPIELSFKLLLSAGVVEGAMVPIQKEMFGENSTFYLSHTSFYMMMASGFFMSIMADAWLKLQEDARQDDMGEFGKIPQGEDATRGFMQWYHKQFFAEKNSLMANWAFSNYVSFWNLPAGLANISLFYFMFSGRIDLSLLFSGYAIAFGTPFSALHYKVDQAFERAAHYAARGIKDPKWLAHPEVQKFLIPEMQRYRDHFTVYKDIYANVSGNLINNWEMIPTAYGTRGLTRALLGGGLLEEYIVNGALQPMQTAVAGVPVLGPVMTPLLQGCELILTNGNPDLTRIKK